MGQIDKSGHEVFVDPGKKRLRASLIAFILLLGFTLGAIFFANSSSSSNASRTWYQDDARTDITFADFLASTPEQANATAGMLLCESLWKDHPTARINQELMKPYTEQLMSLIYILVASDVPIETDMHTVFADLIDIPENVKLLQPRN
jgi:hypothetical protein